IRDPLVTGVQTCALPICLAGAADADCVGEGDTAAAAVSALAGISRFNGGATSVARDSDGFAVSGALARAGATFIDAKVPSLIKCSAPLSKAECDSAMHGMRVPLFGSIDVIVLNEKDAKFFVFLPVTGPFRVTATP